MLLKEVTSFLESLAPLQLQEEYDNSGLLTGDPLREVTGILVSLDCTEEIVDEAIEKKCNLIVSHHPVIFREIKKLSAGNYVNRSVIKAIKNDIALYAIHTNADNIHTGVNKMICDKLGLVNTRVLSPKNEVLRKLVVFCPGDHAEKLRTALFEAGGGRIGNYSECSFNLSGEGTFKAGDQTNPFVGEKEKRHTEKEIRIELIYPVYAEKHLLKAMNENHPYEEIAYDIYPLANEWGNAGSGMTGELETALDEKAFLERLKQVFGVKMIRHTALSGKNIKKVAVCGGSGSFLISKAIASGAGIFITSDIKYHEFFDAENKLVIADIGHYESEQFTTALLGDWLTKKFTTFAVRLTEKNTNPVHYL